ncbi:MAG: hypothetical protein AAF824_01005 [Bacteroidota bacterium]
MTLVKLLLNFSLLLSLLITPCLVLMGYWYRKQFIQKLMVWKKPEMVIVTIIFSVASLILFVVGVSCFFSAWGYLETRDVLDVHKERFFDIGLICMLLNVSLLFIYSALRLLLVRIITDKGIVQNDKVLRIPDYRNTIEWHEVSDYYLVSDYPNVIFSLIIQKEPAVFERITLKVPVYVRDEFENLLETKMYSASAMRARSQINRHKFSEN